VLRSLWVVERAGWWERDRRPRGQAHRFVRLEPGQPNLVDCAIAKLNVTVQADVHRLKGSGFGPLAGQRADDPEIGEVVSKAGRITGVGHGRVTALELEGVAGNRSFSDVGA
jgi:hypothetical protein